jgi:hypothetical protein
MDGRHYIEAYWGPTPEITVDNWTGFSGLLRDAYSLLWRTAEVESEMPPARL